ncbi:bifunctional lysylphosphatidylglycerol flippase/synthetase MprF [Streptomyces flavofungini]|uniref:DUF2156 domain-containing protein n=1 Tax=Streptomyces flavofungini TaxID=68200 RepID=A0ABS0XJ85_9ACTN|nr:DUF2156 domain-containing protein [Streptomyces flavofungini]MBJ3813260.1 DUF2156 domain-containing protein [Streptomyces flavofungini]GHC90871.1 hypothetical protein GCM10010349_79200 [Streptomyces flavofungini]
MNSGTKYLNSQNVDGFLAYRMSGRRNLIGLCGPICDPGDRQQMIAELVEFARHERRHVMAVQISREEAEIYAKMGFIINQIGASFSLDITDYTLRGNRMSRVRSMINRASREGIFVKEVDHAELQGTPALKAALDRIDERWLASKGQHAKKLDFLVGEREGPGASYRRVFAAMHGSEMIAYVSYSPVFGHRPGWLYDLTRRLPSAPPGTIEMIFSNALAAFRAEGYSWVHLGFTPFAQMKEFEDIPNPASPATHKALSFLRKKGSLIYPSGAQEAFKLKWRPQSIDPEYMASQGRVRIGAIWNLLRTVGAV